MRISLGQRLRQVASFVPMGARLADIGSDHGYLTAWLLQNGRIELAIAGELNREPAERARQTARAAAVAGQMQVREGAGLTVLQPGEVDTVVIAGLGGTTIIEILQSNPAVLASVQRLILQPNVGGAQVRHWLADHSWQIVDEALVAENDIIYEIIVAEPGQMLPLTPLQAEIGPVLLQKRPPYFAPRIRSAIAERQHVVSQLANSTSDAAAAKRQRLVQEIEDLEALLT